MCEKQTKSTLFEIFIDRESISHGPKSLKIVVVLVLVLLFSYVFDTQSSYLYLVILPILSHLIYTIGIYYPCYNYTIHTISILSILGRYIHSIHAISILFILSILFMLFILFILFHIMFSMKYLCTLYIKQYGQYTHKKYGWLV